MVAEAHALVQPQRGPKLAAGFQERSLLEFPKRVGGDHQLATDAAAAQLLGDTAIWSVRTPRTLVQQR
jgi:hypothetical protein